MSLRSGSFTTLYPLRVAHHVSKRPGCSLNVILQLSLGRSTITAAQRSPSKSLLNGEKSSTMALLHFPATIEAQHISIYTSQTQPTGSLSQVVGPFGHNVITHGISLSHKCHFARCVLHKDLRISHPSPW